MGFIGTIIIGFVIGLIARFLTPGKDVQGFLMTTILGVAGAFAASYFGQTMGWYMFGEPAGFLASVIGAVALLCVYRAVAKR